jgi:beta-glucosidase
VEFLDVSVISNRLRRRIVTFEDPASDRVELQPGESREVTLTVDPRLPARFDGDSGHWHIAEGTYTIALGKASDSLSSTADVELDERLFGA